MVQKMLLSNILIYFIVCVCAAVWASPSVQSTQKPWIGRGCRNAQLQPLEDQSSAIETAVAPFKLAIEIQAQTIQSLMKSLEAVELLQKMVQELNHTIIERTLMTTPTPAAPHCASDEFVTSAVNAAVFPLQQTILELNQTILELTPKMTASLAPNCMSEKSIASAVIDAVLRMQELNGSMFYYELPTVTSPTPAPNCASDEFVTNAVNAAKVPLQQTINELKQTILELTMTTTTPTPTTTLSPTTTTLKPAPHCAADYQYHVQMNSCYKRHRNAVHWTVANTICSGEDAHLAVINSYAEGRTIIDMMQAAGWPWTYIGAYQNSGVWMTVTGENFIAAAGYDPWQRPDWPTQRDVDSARKYVVFYDRGAVNVDDTENHHFICEKKPMY